MPYNNTTPGVYKIPYWARGERASEQSNLRAAQIIENQLRASNQFFGANGVIQEGTYTGVFSSGNSSVVLAPTASIPALEAVLAYKYVNQTDNLQWLGLPNSSTIYLYAQAVEQNIYQNGEISTLQFSECVAVWNTSGSTPTQSILLAKVITTTSGMTVDSSASITDNGDYIAGKPIYYSFGSHRTAIPIDHPNLSVTDVKLANQAVLSRTIAPWDGLSSGTDVTNGKGIADGHIKRKAVTAPKLDLTGGENIPITGALDLTGFMYISSGLSTGGLVAKGDATISSGLDVYGTSIFRGAAIFQTSASLGATITRLNTQTICNSGLDIYVPSLLVRGDATFQGMLTNKGFANRQILSSGLTSAGGIIERSGVCAQAGYTGRVDFYRQSIGYLQDPVDLSVDGILLPAFRFPATITEVVVESRLPASGDCQFELRNASGGLGTALSGTLRNSERYNSGVGVLPLTPNSSQIAFRMLSLTSSLSGLNVFVSGFQQVPSPSPNIP